MRRTIFRSRFSRVLRALNDRDRSRTLQPPRAFGRCKGSRQMRELLACAKRADATDCRDTFTLFFVVLTRAPFATACGYTTPITRHVCVDDAHTGGKKKFRDVTPRGTARKRGDKKRKRKKRRQDIDGENEEEKKRKRRKRRNSRKKTKKVMKRRDRGKRNGYHPRSLRFSGGK